MVRRWERLTPDEFAVHAEVWHRRQARAWDRLAVLVCHVTRPHLTKPMTPSQVLGRPLSGASRRQQRVADEDDD